MLSKQGLDHVRETLYAPDRLERRFRYFETLSLPSLIKQADQGFHAAVLIGQCMPDAPRARLEALLGDHDNLHLIALPAQIHIKAVRAAYDALPVDRSASHVATFRLDDDDAMHVETTQTIRRLGTQYIGMRDPERPFVLAFNRGFYLNAAHVKSPLTEVFERHPLGVGMTLVAPVGAPDTVFRRNHRNVAQFYDTFSDVDRPMFVRSIHADNDSTPNNSGREGRMPPGRIARHLETGFGLSLEDLRSL